MQALDFSVVSLNLARERDVASIVHELTSNAKLTNADVFMFQEVAGQTKAANVAEAVARELGYFVVAIPSSSESPDQGLAILSRHPLSDAKTIPLKRFDLRFHSRIRFAIAATVMTPQGPMRVWDVHLDSRINADDRVEQLAPVLEDARGHAVSVIGGDLNTTHFQWLLNVLPSSRSSTQVRTIRGAFERAEFRSPLANELVTFPFLGQHLDWIFARGLQAGRSGVTPMDFSDHYAVWADFHMADSSITR
ncbi:MAG: endonuclease/exonuclease/phosphatase family protein [Bryobacteraceae bacterium]